MCERREGIKVRMFRSHPDGGPADPSRTLTGLQNFEKCGERLLDFGMRRDRTRLWLLENDLEYAQWIVAENTKNPMPADDPFAKTAMWLEEAFLIMENRDETFMDRLCKLKRDAERKAFEDRRRWDDEVRALKALRRSTANGQIAQLPPELLLQILKATGRNPYAIGINPILNLPQVCRELRRLLGPLTVSSPRMTLMIAGTFELLSPIKAKITGGRPVAAARGASGVHRIGEGVAPDVQYRRVWRHMKYLANHTLIDLPNTQLCVVRTFSTTEYQALAVRSMQHKTAFLALKHDALNALQRMGVTKIHIDRVAGQVYYEGRTKDTELLMYANKMAQEREKLATLVKGMKALNTEHSLYLAIPKMFRDDAAERRLLQFLSS